MEIQHDLSCDDVWAEAIERSLARRGRTRRASVELARLRPPRDLTCVDVIRDSTERSLARRAAAQGASQMRFGAKRRGLSVAALLAMTATPAAGLLGGAAAAQAAPRVVKKGSHGGAVKRLQRALGVTADGVFGPHTRKALRSFQHRHGLAVDGIAGPATWAALGHAPQAASSHHRDGGKHHKRHVIGGSVREAQRLLGVTADGVFGPQTKGAVRRFQRRHGLAVDGVVGPQTWAALRGGGGAHHASRHHASERKGGSVRSLQRALGVGVDGVFGPQTEAAVKSYQRRHGLTVDGVVGPQTWDSLGIDSDRILKRRHHGGGGGGHSGAVATMIAAGNRIASLPYKWGGGHGTWNDSGYDCSGSVSYVLHAAGLLSSPLDSSSLESYGLPGPGRHVTIYANAGHTYMTIDGRRFDTSARSETGSRWTSTSRSSAGFVVRHPRGL